MSKQLPEGRSAPEIMPPETELATLSPTMRLYIRRAAITSLAGFLFWFLLWCLQSFLGVRGVVQMVASRILLFFMWLSGTGLIVLGALTLPRLQRRRVFAVTVNIVWLIGVVALDKWAPRPTSSPHPTAAQPEVKLLPSLPTPETSNPKEVPPKQIPPSSRSAQQQPDARDEKLEPRLKNSTYPAAPPQVRIVSQQEQAAVAMRPPEAVPDGNSTNNLHPRSSGMSPQQVFELVEYLARVLDRLRPIAIVITAPKENSEFKADIHRLIDEACGKARGACPPYKEPDPDIDVVAGIPQPRYEGIVVHAADTPLNVADAFVHALNGCIVMHKDSAVPPEIMRSVPEDFKHLKALDISSAPKTVWLEIGHGNPWRPICEMPN